MADDVVLTEAESVDDFIQEIVVRKNGVVEIPWITPRASELVLELWELFGGDKPFAVKRISGNIYCG